MSDQMTPAEMRGRAHSLRLALRPDSFTDSPNGPSVEMFISNVRAGADALDAVARVRNVYERYCDLTVDGCSEQTELLLADISAALEGEDD